MYLLGEEQHSCRALELEGKVHRRGEPREGEQEEVSWCPEKPIWRCHQRQLPGDGLSKQRAKFPVGCGWRPPVEPMAWDLGLELTLELALEDHFYWEVWFGM